ncbi:hypothetical protein [Shewanella sp. YLB-07]|uniref:hypothetical protein n=1 Tax=Shewanella sp. YLB-07 TaxID=2601268 RepID=UPI00128BCB8F|nr:hypothetical protein [Shewanella sp. YLB-07]MPY25005.1 hypothetical protein [Shewanella sp. YLB-07]
MQANGYFSFVTIFAKRRKTRQIQSAIVASVMPLNFNGRTMIQTTLPNTSNDSSGSNTFSLYLKANSIAINSSDAVTHYQCSKNNGYEVNDSQLNFCLEVEAEGNQSKCAIDGLSTFGSVADLNHNTLLDDLESEFKAQSFFFDSKSIVYKGISSDKPYYNKFTPSACSVGDIIDIYTFFSTTVSKERAKNYGSVLLKIQGLDKVNCIIPPITTIPGSGELTDEQEVLINRGFKAKVLSVNSYEIHLQLEQA